MARYFFDVQDGELSVIDEDGTELDGRDDAVSEAARILVELAKGRLPGTRERELSVRVREGGRPVVRANLSFSVVPLT